LTAADPRRGNGKLIAGLILAAVGRKAGFAQFGATSEAFLATLAPPFGFLIVLCGVLAWAGYALPALALFLVITCNLLAPAVITEAVCRLWQRREQWLRYANVLNCMPWLILGLLTVMMPLASVAVSAGVPPQQASAVLLLGTGLYSMWFNWFAARQILQLSVARALGVMLAGVIGTYLLLQIPGFVSEVSGHRPESAKLQDIFGFGAPEDAAGK
jgi:hypothetical protein